jgi:hypothetical protein
MTGGTYLAITLGALWTHCNLPPMAFVHPHIFVVHHHLFHGCWMLFFYLPVMAMEIGIFFFESTRGKCTFNL